MSKDLKKLMSERTPSDRIQVKPEKLIPVTVEEVQKSGFVHKTTKPQVVKYTTHLDPGLIKAVKWYALESGLKDYEVVRLSLEAYLESKSKAEK